MRTALLCTCAVLLTATTWAVARYGTDWGTTSPAAAMRQEAIYVAAAAQAGPVKPAAGSSRGGAARTAASRASPRFLPGLPPIGGDVNHQHVARPTATVAIGGADSSRLPSEAQPPAEQLAIGDVQVTSVSPTQAHISWTTNFPSTGVSAQNVSGEPLLWSPADSGATQHETVLSNLNGNTAYDVSLKAIDEWGRVATAELAVRTADQSSSTVAQVDGDTIVVDGRPFFPRAVWSDCSNAVGSKVAVGINLFMSEGCGKPAKLVDAIKGRAYAVVDPTSGLSGHDGVIGEFYPDELDGRVSGPISSALIQSQRIFPPLGRLSFLTLTNHFYSRADPLPMGRSVYLDFVSLAQVLGFDLYPLQNWCRSDRFADVFDAQQELDRLTQGKPTYQWIEVRRMDCSALLDPTPQTVRLETWLAIAGGADGIGYFPADWSPAIGSELSSLNSRISDLTPALLAPHVDVTASGQLLRVGARVLNDALYVIAVNPTAAPVDGSLQLDAAGDRTFDVLGENRQLVASGGTISDHFDPLSEHIYIAAPPAWSPPR